MRISVSVEIERSKAEVWSAITDIENAQHMISGILALKIIHKPEDGIVGLKWTETRKMFGKEASETMWITESKSEEFYRTRAESHGSLYLTKMAIKELDADTTELTMSFSAEAQSKMIKIISSIMGLFVNKSMKKMLLSDLQEIKKYVEAQPTLS